jgi:hypothetical protein
VIQVLRDHLHDNSALQARAIASPLVFPHGRICSYEPVRWVGSGKRGSRYGGEAEPGSIGHSTVHFVRFFRQFYPLRRYDGNATWVLRFLGSWPASFFIATKRIDAGN